MPDDDGLALLASLEADVDGVAAAIARLEDGTYGRCRACGAALDDDLLAADPLVTACPDHLPL